MLKDKRAFVGQFNSQKKGSKLRWIKFAAGFFLVDFSNAAFAQAINIDLNDPFGGPETGGGVPSSGFGAAAGQPGFWNGVLASGAGAFPLKGLDGLPSSAQISASGGIGSMGGFNNPNLSGDFRLLMADYAWVGGPIRYQFSGFEPGNYRIFTYGADASGAIKHLYVRVPGSTTPMQSVTGPMPANQFIYGIDYCAHDLQLFGDSFEIDVDTDGFPLPPTQVHGFQVVAVPEVNPVFVCTLGLAALLGLRRPRV